MQDDRDLERIASAIERRDARPTKERADLAPLRKAIDARVALVRALFETNSDGFALLDELSPDPTRSPRSLAARRINAELRKLRMRLAAAERAARKRERITT